MFERGVIKNENFAKVINDFSGLQRHRNITPTDIDGFIDYNGNAAILLEGKFSNCEMSLGQQICFQNIANNYLKPLLVIIYDNLYISEDKIDVKNSIVFKVYYNESKKWDNIINKNYTVLELIELMEQHWINKGIQI